MGRTMDLRREMERAFERRPDKKKEELASRLGLKPSAVSDMLTRSRKPRNIRATEVPIIREYLELDPVVKVVGFVGAGSEAHFYGEASDDPAEYVPAPVNASSETVAVEIRGDSLGPAFNGWLAFYNDRREPIDESLYGRLCIVGLDSGQVLIKIPRPAREKGLFHLFPNAGGDVILDARITWAARVTIMEPKR